MLKPVTAVTQCSSPSSAVPHPSTSALGDACAPENGSERDEFNDRPNRSSDMDANEDGEFFEDDELAPLCLNNEDGLSEMVESIDKKEMMLQRLHRQLEVIASTMDAAQLEVRT